MHGNAKSSPWDVWGWRCGRGRFGCRRSRGRRSGRSAVSSAAMTDNHCRYIRNRLVTALLVQHHIRHITIKAVSFPAERQSRTIQPNPQPRFLFPPYVLREQFVAVVAVGLLVVGKVLRVHPPGGAGHGPDVFLGHPHLFPLPKYSPPERPRTTLRHRMLPAPNHYRADTAPGLDTARDGVVVFSEGQHLPPDAPGRVKGGVGGRVFVASPPLLKIGHRPHDPPGYIKRFIRLRAMTEWMKLASVLVTTGSALLAWRAPSPGVLGGSRGTD